MSFKYRAGLAESNGSHLRADCLYTGYQLRAQRSVTNMGEVYLYHLV